MRGELHLCQHRVRARSDDDLVLPGGVDQDEGDSSRLGDRAKLERDTRSPHRSECLLGEGIAAHRPDERDVGSEEGTCDRLIRTLSPRHTREGRTADRFTSSGQSLAARDEVEVDRPDDGDAGPPRNQGQGSSQRRTLEAAANTPCNRLLQTRI